MDSNTWSATGDFYVNVCIQGQEVGTEPYADNHGNTVFNLILHFEKQFSLNPCWEGLWLSSGPSD